MAENNLEAIYETKRIYNWDIPYRTGFWKNWGEKAFPYKARAVLKMLESLKCKGIPRLAVDMGCGAGTQTKLLADSRLFDKVVGFDVSSKALEISKERSAQEIIEYSQADILTIPEDRFKKDSIGAILDLSVSTHIDPKELPKYFKNIAYWLSLEGIFLFSVWSANSKRTYNVSPNPDLDYQNLPVKFEGQEAEMPNYFYSEKGLCGLLNECFNIEDLDEIAYKGDDAYVDSIKWWFAFCSKK